MLTFCNVAIDSSPTTDESVGCSFFAKSEMYKYMEILYLYFSLPVCIFWTNTQFSCFLFLWPYFLVTKSLLNTLWFIWVVSKGMLVSKTLGKVSGDFHDTTYPVLHEESGHLEQFVEVKSSQTAKMTFRVQRLSLPPFLEFSGMHRYSFGVCNISWAFPSIFCLWSEGGCASLIPCPREGCAIQNCTHAQDVHPMQCIAKDLAKDVDFHPRVKG